MAEHARPFFPLWQRGSPGFKCEPFRAGGWGWRYLDLNGYALHECAEQFETETQALDSCAEYWRFHRHQLQLISDIRERENPKAMGVAPEWKP
jgi:hypothetical protein